VPVVSAGTTLDVWMDVLGDHTMSEDERLGIFSMYYDITNLSGILENAPRPLNITIDADHEGSNAVTKTVVATGAAAAITTAPVSEKAHLNCDCRGRSSHVSGTAGR
jgi:hypothetical protein